MTDEEIDAIEGFRSSLFEIMHEHSPRVTLWILDATRSALLTTSMPNEKRLAIWQVIIDATAQLVAKLKDAEAKP